MDEVIFEEFKGTGNSELILDRKLSDKRVFPSIDVTKSGTRKEELLVSKDDLSKMWILRKILMPMGVNDSMEFLIDKIKGSKNNADFFESMKSLMKIISWNVNSIRIRKEQLFDLLYKEDPDFVCLQEIKSSNDAFPTKDFKGLNYFSYVNGMPSYNGVEFYLKKKLNLHILIFL